MKSFLLSIVFIIISTSIFSQNYVTGGIEEDEKVYHQIPPADFYENTKSDVFDSRTDLLWGLKLPVQQQGDTRTCTSMAVTNALAINYGQQTDKKQFTIAELPSAWYLHRTTSQQRKRSCKDGLPISAVLQQLTERGTMTNSDSPVIGDCNIEIKNPTTFYRIQQFKRLFAANATAEVKRYQIKKSLSKKYPVIFNIGVDDNFTQLTADNCLYLPTSYKTSSLGTHTMVIVGYSEAKKAFKVLNSWGKNWGKEGWCWIPYHVIEAQCHNAYLIETTVKASPAPCLSPKNVLEGDFQLRTIDGEIHLQDDIYQPTFRIRQLTKQGATFVATQPLEAGEPFQIRTENLPHHLCAFSYDGSGNLQLHYPQERGDVCPGSGGGNYRTFLPSTENDVTVPFYDADALTQVGDKNVVTNPKLLQKTQVGTDYFVMLYSLEKITPSVLSDLLCKLESETSSENFVNDLQRVFNNYLMSPNEIKYAADGLRFSAASCKGVAVPIVIQID